MGKRAKRALRKKSSIIDEVDMTSNNDANDNESIGEDQEVITGTECPYLTNIVSVMVGSPPMEFKVHSGVFSKSVVLESQYQTLRTWDHLSLPSVNPSVFERALCYMYGGEHCEYFSPSHPVPKKADAKAAVFQQDCMLYCFARNYQLERLVTLTIKKIKGLGRLEYHSVFSAAKEAYKQLPDDESWFRDCFKQETKKALRDVHDLVHEPWLLDAFRDGTRYFTLDLFTAMTEAYEKIISKSIATGHRSSSATKLSSWFSPNLNHDADDFSTGSSSVDWAEDRSTSERDETAGETEGDETMSVAGSYCVEGLTPSGDSGCVVEAFPDVDPADAVEAADVADVPQEEAANPVPEGPFDLDVPWGSWGNSKKARKKREGLRHFLSEDVPAEEPVFVPAEEVIFSEETSVPVEEVIFAEEPPMEIKEAMRDEEPPMAAEEAVFSKLERERELEPAEVATFAEEELLPAEDMRAESPVAREEAPAPCEEAPAPCEEAPVPCEEAPTVYEEAPVDPVEETASIAPDPEPVSAAEDGPADLRPEPLWGFSAKKSKNRAKKKTWFTPPNPLEPEIPDLAPQDEAPAPAPDDASISRQRFASLPVFKYLAFEGGVQPDDTACTCRGYHLANESRWMQCQKCRGELSALARKMARDSNPGWIFT